MKQRIFGIVCLALILTGCGLLGNRKPPAPALPQPNPPAAALPMAQSNQTASSIVVDNADPGFRIQAGDWGTCSGSDCSGIPYRSDFYYADPSCSDCRAGFELGAVQAGTFDLYTWWPRGDDRATDTPFTIQSGSRKSVVQVNQRDNGSAWYKLTTLTLNAGETVNVVVSGTSSGYANADAVVLVPSGGVPPANAAAAQPVAAETPVASFTPLAPPTVGAPQAAGTRAKIIFLHHSTGQGIIQEGGLRERLTAFGYEFYDHGYNDEGLVLADGTATRTNFNIPDDNTNPDGFANLFAQPVHSPPDNAFSHLLQYDVVAFKSCFPVSDIQSDEQLEEYKNYYLAVRNTVDQHRDKLFVVVTQPPLVPRATKREDAARARAFANWLKSPAFLNGHPNLVTFDLFQLLAEDNPLSPEVNMLRAAYRGSDPEDSHPNPTANQAVAPPLADFLDRAAKAFRPAAQAPVPAANAAPQPAVQPSPIAPAAAASALVCPGAQPAFITDLDVRQVPSLADPAPRVPFRDPVFGSCIVRVTDRKRDLSPDDTSPGMKNEYSRVQAFNADGTRLIARTTTMRWYLYDALTLQPLGEMPLEFDPRWDVANPDLVYYSSWGDDTHSPRFMSYNVKTQAQAVVHDFGPDFPGQKLAAVWSRFEGAPSLDGRYWAFQVEDADWHRVALVVYDQKENRLVAQRDLRGVTGADDIDNTTISPLGNYVLVDFAGHYCERGTLGTDASPCGMMVYDRSLKNGRGLLRIMGHNDPALDAQGREVIVFQDVDTDNISMVDMATGQVTALLPIDFSHTALGLHLSGRALGRPGWVVVSTYDGGDPTSYTWMDNQVFVVELKKGGRVVRLAHTRSIWKEGVVAYGEKDYWAEAHGSANPDLTRILFTSNWGRGGTEEVEMYMIQLPADWDAR